MTADRVAMIDWDESHVDVPDLDLALPHNAAGLGDDAYDIAAQARAAWEAAVCWGLAVMGNEGTRWIAEYATSDAVVIRHCERPPVRLA
jgi:hypothetical protein